MLKKTTKELRKFGIIIAIALAILGSIVLWRGKPTYIYFYGISGLFFAMGLIVPKALFPIEWVWMKFAKTLGFVMNHVILTITFFLVITPIGLIMRLAGKDLLKLKFDKNAESYWIKTEPDGPATRPDKPY